MATTSAALALADFRAAWMARVVARTHWAGSCSLAPAGSPDKRLWGAEPSPRTRPETASTMSALVDCVPESMPMRSER